MTELGPAEQAAARERLLAAGDAVRAELAGLERARADLVAAAQGANLDDEHDPEGATVAYERAQLAALHAAAAGRLIETEHALRRLEQASYGRCVQCGTAIGADRLSALPATQRCVRCATPTRRR